MHDLDPNGDFSLRRAFLPFAIACAVLIGAIALGLTLAWKISQKL